MSNNITMFTVNVIFWQRSFSGCLLWDEVEPRVAVSVVCPHIRPPPLSSVHPVATVKGPNTTENGHTVEETHVPCFVSCCASSVLMSHKEKGGNKAAPEVCASLHTSPWIQQWGSGRCQTALIGSVCVEGGVLARRPVIAQTQLRSGDGHLVHAGWAHFRRKVNDPTVVLHVLKFIFLGRLHVNHWVFVDVLL